LKIVFIHGRAQGGKDEHNLKGKWEDAFDQGLFAAGLTRPDGLEIAFPFYGNRLDELIEQWDADSLENLVTRGAQTGEVDATFIAEFLEEIAADFGISDQEIQAHMTRGATERSPLNWGWVRALAQALDKSNKLGEMAIEKFTRDVFLYLTNRTIRRAINEIIEDDLSGDPCVVVGHSLGSIVGFNVLKKNPHPVARFVTVGSPLGVKAVKRFLEKPIAMPAKTGEWYNAMDVNDIVSLHPLEKPHFGIEPPISNHTNVNNKTDNQHGITGYLDDEWVAEAIIKGHL